MKDFVAICQTGACQVNDRFGSLIRVPHVAHIRPAARLEAIGDTIACRWMPNCTIPRGLPRMKFQAPKRATPHRNMLERL
jgi:hypothetical protein